MPSIAQESFETPDAAASALVETFRSGDLDRLFAVLGSAHRDALVADDPEGLRANMAVLADAAAEQMSLEPDGEDAMILVLGPRDWPSPIPLIRRGGKWSFDTGAGIEEIRIRRIGANELQAIEVARRFIGAQAVYAAEDRDGDRVLEYAQQILSSPGLRDGLYWPGEDPADQSPFGPYVAELGADPSARAREEPFHGYAFRILTRQADGVPGGRYDYVINGNMIAGFGLLAVPARYGETGVTTFLVSHHGTVWEKDLGPETALLAAAIQEVRFDESWEAVEE
ncbi:DUF2950 family protein [Inquilinus sp. CAU 1745]|uniref:DUF2950 family protein n=1 Tax=Inquilinus sp. CAU 1745 TaxID=3140369 RepID=UPI00325B001F